MAGKIGKSTLAAPFFLSISADFQFIDGTTTASTTTKQPTTLKTAKPGKCSVQNFLARHDSSLKTIVIHLSS
jgi:hypothetical protein